MTSTSTRWRVAHWLDRLKRTCWCDLVDYVLSHREDNDPEERQFLFRRNRVNGEVITTSLFRHLVFGPWGKPEYCREQAATKGSCYCGKFATKEVRDQTSLCPKFVVLGTTPESRLEPKDTNRTDGFLSA